MLRRLGRRQIRSGIARIIGQTAQGFVATIPSPAAILLPVLGVLSHNFVRRRGTSLHS